METHLLTYNDLIWPLGSQDSIPAYRVGCGEWKRNHKVDPYPAYYHNIKRVKDLAAQCEEAFPLTGTRTAFYLLSHEDIDRVNGVTFCDNLYNQGKGKTSMECTCGCGKVSSYPLATWVILCGKRIPPHPAMTRYLVAHEYGHMVWNHVRKMLGYGDSCEDKLYEIYMKTRGVTDYVSSASGGKWHKSPSEIMANDFRLLFTNQEREFWPHDVPHPEETPIAGWWWDVHAQALKISKNTE